VETHPAEPRVVIDLNPSEQRFYDQLRSYITTNEPGTSSGIWDLLLLLPDLTVLLFRMARDVRVTLSSKVIAVLAIGYVLSPFELMPELVFGPIGLIDDLVVVGTALSRMLNRVHPDVVRGHWSGQGDALVAIQRVTQWTETQVTSRLRGAWQRISGVADAA
jgi:uncharacterized membrane protein YkvA (DUF1232 family)